MKCTLSGAEVGRALKAVASICPSNKVPPTARPLGGMTPSHVTDGVYFTFGDGGRISIWACDMKRIIVWFPDTRATGDLGNWVMDAKQAMALAETARVVQKDMEISVDDEHFEVRLGGATMGIPFTLSKLPLYDLSRSYPGQDIYGTHCVVDPTSLAGTLRKFKVRANNGTTFNMRVSAQDNQGLVTRSGKDAVHRFHVIAPGASSFQTNFVHEYLKDAVEALLPLNPQRLQLSYGEGVPLRLQPDGFPTLQAYVWRVV